MQEDLVDGVLSRLAITNYNDCRSAAVSKRGTGGAFRLALHRQGEESLKYLLTSAGIKNASIHDALVYLLG
jgi:hypothetical protein